MVVMHGPLSTVAIVERTRLADYVVRNALHRLHLHGMVVATRRKQGQTVARVWQAGRALQHLRSRTFQRMLVPVRDRRKQVA